MGNTKKILLLTLTITIFLATTIQADQPITVSELDFYRNGDKVEYISTQTNRILIVDMPFTYTAPEGLEITSITADISDIYPAHYADPEESRNYENIQVPSCEEENGAHHCELRNLRLRTTRNPVNIKITFQTSQGPVTIEKQHTFQVYNNPNLRAQIQIPNCDSENRCFLAPGIPHIVRAVMDESPAGYSTITMFLAMTGLQHRMGAITCEGTTCSFQIQPTCTNPSSVTLRTLPDSHDLAGNPVQASKSFTCDPNPPTIQTKTAYSTTGQEVITTTSRFTLEVNVTESTSTTVNMTVDGTNILADNATVQCQRAEGNKFVCRAEMRSGLETGGVHTIPFTVTDLAGNTARDTIQVQFHEETTEESPAFWNVRSVQNSHNTLFRENLDYKRDVMVQVDLQSIRGNPSIVGITAPSTRCDPVIPNRTGAFGDISDFSIKYVDKENNRLYASLSVREENADKTRYANVNQLEFNCPINILTKSGDYFYSTPQKLNFTINIGLRNVDSFDGNLKQEMEATKNRVDRMKEQWRWYEGTLETIYNACRIAGGVDSAAASVAAAEGIVALIPGMQGAAKGLGKSADGLGDISRGTSGVASDGLKFFREVCTYATCDSEMQRFLPGLIGSGFDSLGIDTVTDYLPYDVESSLDPFRSKYVAYATACPPAIVHHMKVDAGIECNYLNCLSEGVGRYAIGVSDCKADREFARCVVSRGAIFDTIPLVSTIRQSLALVSEIVREPMALFGVAAPWACKWMPSGTTVHAFCVVGVSIPSMFNIFNTLKNIARPPHDPSDQCGIVMSSIDWITFEWQDPPGTIPPEFKYDATYSIQGLDDNKLDCKGGTCTYKLSGLEVTVIPETKEGRVTGYNFYHGTGEGRAQVWSPRGVPEQEPEWGELIPGVSHEEILRIAETQESVVLTDLSGDPGWWNRMHSVLGGNYWESEGTRSVTTLESLKENPGLTQQQRSFIQNIIDDPALRGLYEQGIIDVRSDGAVILSGKHLGQFVSTTQQAHVHYTEMMNKFNDMDSYTFDRFIDLMGAKEEHAQAKIEASNVIFAAESRENAYEQIQRWGESDVELTPEMANDLRNHFRNVLGEELYDGRPALDSALQMYIRDCPGEFDGGCQISVKEAVSLFTDLAGGGDVLEKARDDAKSAKKSAADELKSARRAEEASFRRLWLSERYHQLFGNSKRAAQTMWSTAGGFLGMQNVFGWDWGLSDKHVLNYIGRFFDDLAHPEIAWCEKSVRKDRSTRSVGYNVGGIPGTYRTGANIFASRSHVAGEDGYQYFIGGSVSTIQDGLSFRVLMMKGDGSRNDITRDIFENDNVFVYAGTPVVIGGSSRGLVKSYEESYDMICYEFNTNNLGEYFTHVRSSSRIFCQNIVVEGGN